jgi:hypothetical protein
MQAKTSSTAVKRKSAGSAPQEQGSSQSLSAYRAIEPRFALGRSS